MTKKFRVIITKVSLLKVSRRFVFAGQRVTESGLDDRKITSFYQTARQFGRRTVLLHTAEEGNYQKIDNLLQKWCKDADDFNVEDVLT